MVAPRSQASVKWLVLDGLLTPVMQTRGKVASHRHRNTRAKRRLDRRLRLLDAAGLFRSSALFRDARRDYERLEIQATSHIGDAVRSNSTRV